MISSRQPFRFVAVLLAFAAAPYSASAQSTVTDVVGFFSFLGIATLWFGLRS